MRKRRIEIRHARAMRLLLDLNRSKARENSERRRSLSRVFDEADRKIIETGMLSLHAPTPAREKEILRTRQLLSSVLRMDRHGAGKPNRKDRSGDKGTRRPDGIREWQDEDP